MGRGSLINEGAFQIIEAIIVVYASFFDSNHNSVRLHL